MASPDADRTAGSRSPAGMRFWAVGLLTLGVVVWSSLLVATDRMAPSGGWLWVVCAAIALVCWSVPRSRSAGRALLVLLAVIFSWIIPFPDSPVEALDDGRLSGLGRAILGEGAATVPQTLLAIVAVVAALLSFWPTRPAPGSSTPRSAPARWAGPASGLAVAALAFAVCVPVAYALQGVSQSRQVARVEDSQIIDRPEVDDVSDVRIGERSGWSRDSLLAAQPAGDRVIALESGPADGDRRPIAAIVGLRATDGALLWRYRLQTPENQSAVGPAIIDVDSRTVMVTYVDALIGIDFDGHVAYRKSLSESVPPNPRPVLISDTFQETSPTLQLSSVAVFGGNRAGTPAQFAVGYAVSTGERLWQVTTESEACTLGRASGPGQRVYLITGGAAPCTTRLIGYDGTDLVFSRDLSPPAEHRDPKSIRAGATAFSWSVPTIATVGTDRVSVGPLWVNGDREDPDQQMVTQTFDQSGQLLGTLPREVAPGASVDLIPTDVDTGPTSPLGTVVVGGGAARWITLTPELEPVAESEIVTGAGYRRVGGLLIVWPFGGKDADHVVDVYTIGPDELPPPEQLDPADLPGSPDQIDSITGDDTHLAIRFQQRVAVLPQ